MKNTSVTIKIDKISFRLRESQNFDWLRNLGKVFCVFDQQDSGNISFGIEIDGNNKFVKYAGAKTLDFDGNPNDAITRLKKAVEVYDDLNHANLIRLENHFETSDGYAAIFDWFNGECLHSHWIYTPYEKYNHPDSPFFRYKNLPVDMRLKSLDKIFSFHEFVESKGYVAVDFYDGSILYDFERNETKICDIDFYRRKPTKNDLGENFWGSRRSKAPEENQLGAVIDEITNVFTMGSIAFGLLGGELDHSLNKWDANEKLYSVALRATEQERDKRFKSVAEFYSAWKEAIV